MKMGSVRDSTGSGQVADFWSLRAGNFDAKYDFATIWHRLLHQPLRIRHEAAMAAVRALDSPSVCDVGCGSGRQMEGALGAGAVRCVGIDLSPEMTARARARLSRPNLRERSQLHTADALKFNPDERFDLVWAFGVFDYIAEPGPMLRKMASLSRGTVLATFRRVWAFRSPFRKVAYHLRGHPIRLYTRRDVQHELEAAGLRDAVVERLHATCYLARASGKFEGAGR